MSRCPDQWLCLRSWSRRFYLGRVGILCWLSVVSALCCSSFPPHSRASLTLVTATHHMNEIRLIFNEIFKFRGSLKINGRERWFYQPFVAADPEYWFCKPADDPAGRITKASPITYSAVAATPQVERLLRRSTASFDGASGPVDGGRWGRWARDIRRQTNDFKRRVVRTTTCYLLAANSPFSHT